jgi:hypothetical protein
MSARASTAALGVVGALACIVVTGCGRAGGHEHVFSSRAEGVAVRYPNNWHLTTRNDNYVPSKAAAVPSRAFSRGR